MKIDNKSLIVGIIFTIVLSILFMIFGLLPIVAGIFGGITGQCLGIVIRNLFIE